MSDNKYLLVNGFISGNMLVTKKEYTDHKLAMLFGGIFLTSIATYCNYILTCNIF